MNFNEWIRFCPTAGQSYCVNLWHNHRFKEPVLQGGHAIWSLGAAIGPFIIRPFLSELQFDGHSDADVNNVSTLNDGWNTTHSLDGSIIQHSSDGPLVHHQSPDGDHANITNISDVMSVRFAYVTIGLIILLCGISFFAIFLANCFSNRKKSSDESDRSIKDGDETTTKGSPSSSCNPSGPSFWSCCRISPFFWSTSREFPLHITSHSALNTWTGQSAKPAWSWPYSSEPTFPGECSECPCPPALPRERCWSWTSSFPQPPMSY